MMMMRRAPRISMFFEPNYGNLYGSSPRQRSLVDDFNSKIVAGDITMDEAPCLCGSGRYDVIATYDRYGALQDIVLCKECGLIRANPRLSHESLSWFYGSDFYRHLYCGGDFEPPSGDEFSALADTYRPLLERATLGIDYSAIDTVAEIGCAAGANLYNFLLDGKKVVGCDLSPAMVRAGRNMGLDITLGNSEVLEGTQFDLVLMSHVLEHFRDPVEEINKVRKLISPNGVLYVEVPDIRYFGIGCFQSAHLYYFTPNLLRHYVAKAGLKCVTETVIPETHSVGMSFVSDGAVSCQAGFSDYHQVVQAIRRFQYRERSKKVLRFMYLDGLAKKVYSSFVSAGLK